jgi:hypothetical protein
MIGYLALGVFTRFKRLMQNGRFLQLQVYLACGVLFDMFGLLAKRLTKNDARIIAKEIAILVVKKEIAPENQILLAEKIFTIVVEDSKYRDYKIPASEVRIIFHHSLKLVEHISRGKSRIGRYSGLTLEEWEERWEQKQQIRQRLIRDMEDEDWDLWRSSMNFPDSGWGSGSWKGKDKKPNQVPD